MNKRKYSYNHKRCAGLLSSHVHVLVCRAEIKLVSFAILD